MNDRLKSTLAELDSEINESYDYARKRFDDPYGEWEHMWDLLIDIRSTMDSLKALLYEQTHEERPG